MRRALALLLAALAVPLAAAAATGEPAPEDASSSGWARAIPYAALGLALVAAGLLAARVARRPRGALSASRAR